MGSWVDHDGKECVASIRKQNTSPVDLVTIYDILDRNSINVIEPNPTDIYIEPFVRYNKNSATGKFDSIIQVTNINYENPTDLQKVSFIVGAQSSDVAIQVYDRCKELSQFTNSVEPPPADMTDLDFVYDYITAMQHLYDWVTWMYNPEIEFKCDAELVDTWEECHRFNLQFPHHTNDAVIECLVEKIKINPNNEHECYIQAIMMADTIPEGFNFQDSLQLAGQLWQDTLDNSNPKKQVRLS
jgi:hypothetical protein